MDTWQQILAVVLGLMVLFFAVPNIRGAMERSKQAEEKHWGSVALIAIVLIAFVILMISSVRH
jgi:putative copper export protein